MGIEISLLNVRRSILIQASPERVWREFQSFDRSVRGSAAAINCTRSNRVSTAASR